MKRDPINGDWTHIASEVRAHWSAFTDHDIAWIGGCQERFADALQAHYGRTREQARAEIEAWLARR